MQNDGDNLNLKLSRLPCPTEQAFATNCRGDEDAIKSGAFFELNRTQQLVLREPRA